MKSYFLAAMIIASFGAQAVELTSGQQLRVLALCAQVEAMAVQAPLYGAKALTGPIGTINSLAISTPESAHALRYAYMEGLRLGEVKAKSQAKAISIKAGKICVKLFTARLGAL